MDEIEIIPIDIINIIIDMTNTRDKLYLMATNKYFLNNITIISMIIRTRISQNIIEQYKFKHIKSLTLLNTNILDISHLNRLTYLKLHEDNVKGLSLLTNITELQGAKYIKSNDIMTLTLLNYLDISFNTRISNISFLTNLKSLCVSGFWSEIDQANIMPLTNLTFLDLGSNMKINNLTHLPHLKKLRSCFDNYIDISKSYKLQTLIVAHILPEAMPCISHLTNLTKIISSEEFINNNMEILKKMTTLTSIIAM